MDAQHRIISTATCGLLLVSISATRFVPASHASPSPRSAPAACTLLTTRDATTAVSGIGDEAFYQIYPKHAPPFIWVRKGNTAFDIRIITGLKPRPFTVEQEKSKETVLAKAAVAKL